MICYKDMTFCAFLDCSNSTCERRLTLEIQKEAEELWGDNPPIATYMAKPKCFEE